MCLFNKLDGVLKAKQLQTNRFQCEDDGTLRLCCTVYCICFEEHDMFGTRMLNILLELQKKTGKTCCSISLASYAIEFTHIGY